MWGAATGRWLAALAVLVLGIAPAPQAHAAWFCVPDVSHDGSPTLRCSVDDMMCTELRVPGDHCFGRQRRADCVVRSVAFCHVVAAEDHPATFECADTAARCERARAHHRDALGLGVSVCRRSVSGPPYRLLNETSPPRPPPATSTPSPSPDSTGPSCPASPTDVGPAFPAPIRFVPGTASVVDPDDVAFLAAVLAAHGEISRLALVGQRLSNEPGGAALALRRARWLQGALVEAGIDPNRLVVAAEPSVASPRAANAGAAVLTRVVATAGTANPLCDDPFPGCRADEVTPPTRSVPYFFRSGAADVPRVTPALRGLAAALQGEDVGVPVELLGMRAPDEPEGLDRRRAEALRDALVGLGVDSSRFVLRGVGSARAGGDAASARRVQVVVGRSATCTPR